MELKDAYRSCYVVDVQVFDDLIQLSDSSKIRYFIDLKDNEVVQQFKLWFKNKFLNGQSQTLTVFRYEIRHIEEGCSNIFITKFMQQQ